jgi:hypothetical protein
VYNPDHDSPAELRADHDRDVQERRDLSEVRAGGKPQGDKFVGVLYDQSGRPVAQTDPCETFADAVAKAKGMAVVLRMTLVR